MNQIQTLKEEFLVTSPPNLTLSACLSYLSLVFTRAKTHHLATLESKY